MEDFESEVGPMSSEADDLNVLMVTKGEIFEACLMLVLSQVEMRHETCLKMRRETCHMSQSLLYLTNILLV